MSNGLKQLQPYLEKSMAIKTAMALFEWDNETLAPEQAVTYTSKVIGVLSSEYFHTITCDEVKRFVLECQKDRSLSEVDRAIVRELSEELERLDCIPDQEYREFAEIIAASSHIWAKAREAQDFAEFAPTLQTIVDFQKKFASYRAKNGEALYNVMLEDYEKGFDMENLDLFFSMLKKELVPFLQEVRQKGETIKNDFLIGDFSEEGQRKLAHFLAEYIGFDYAKGVLAVSAHPFTTNLHNHDVRITTHFSDNLENSLFSVIHEAGHAIYEMGIDDSLTQTLVGQGASMGMHESQSRFFENMIGRSKAFWKPIYGQLQNLFPGVFEKISLDDFVRAINKIEPGLIRTEADELTYSLHIMIRYELEKLLMENKLTVKDLPEAWADKYEEYLGLRPENDAQGVLQDIHWSQGSFGYFPSYALGSAFAAQIYYYMMQKIDVEALLEQGNLAVIHNTLREQIYRHGKLKTSRVLLKDMTGEEFNPKYYIAYLKEKYSRIYKLPLDHPDSLFGDLFTPS